MDGLGNPGWLRVFAAEADGENGSNIRMASQGEQQTDRVFVVIAAGKANNVGIRFTFGDRMRNELSALNGVDHKKKIPDSFAAICTQVALPECFRHTASPSLPLTQYRAKKIAHRTGCGSYADEPT